MKGRHTMLTVFVALRACRNTYRLEGDDIRESLYSLGCPQVLSDGTAVYQVLGTLSNDMQQKYYQVSSRRVGNYIVPFTRRDPYLEIWPGIEY